jgi:hypothetical protein
MSRIDFTMEDDGQVMLAASGLVDYLRVCAEHYGTGRRGGPRLMRKGAHDALQEVADALQSAYIDAAADRLTDTWWRS